MFEELPVEVPVRCDKKIGIVVSMAMYDRCLGGLTRVMVVLIIHDTQRCDRACSNNVIETQPS